MVAFVVPIGQALGPWYSGDEDVPDSYDIRAGDHFFRLNEAGFRVWTLAHGSPELIEHRAPTRAQIQDQARQAGVFEAESLFKDLKQKRLLEQVMPVESQLQRFARSYRACALALGLGNTAEDPDYYSIGAPGDPWAIVDERVYFVW